MCPLLLGIVINTLGCPASFFYSQTARLGLLCSFSVLKKQNILPQRVNLLTLPRCAGPRTTFLGITTRDARPAHSRSSNNDATAVTKKHLPLSPQSRQTLTTTTGDAYGTNRGDLFRVVELRRRSDRVCLGGGYRMDLGRGIGEGREAVQSSLPGGAPSSVGSVSPGTSRVCRSGQNVSGQK